MELDHPAIGACTRYDSSQTDSGFVYLDRNNTLWTEMPGNAFWSTSEREMIVDGMPVHSVANMYVLNYALEDYI